MLSVKRISDRYQRQAVDVLSSLLRFRTVGDSSTVYHEAVSYLDKTARQMGLTSQIMYPSTSRPLLVIKLDGQSKETLLLLSHLDVAPVSNASHWQYPPFGGYLAQGAIWGRGAVDCKGLVVVWLTILRWLQEYRKRLKTSIIFLVTTDEELGTGDSLRWVVERLSTKKYISCALNEGGGYPIQFGQKSFLTCQVGEKGHSLFFTTEQDKIKKIGPKKRDKVIHLSQPLSAVSHHLVKMLLPPLFTQFSPRLLTAILSWQQRNSPQQLDLTQLFFHQATIHSGQDSLSLDFRFLPDNNIRSIEETHQNLQNRLRLQGIRWILQHCSPSTSSPIHHSLYHCIHTAIKSICPQFNVIPHITPGYSDSRVLRLMGIPVFGFFPLIAGTPITNIHSDDEHLKTFDLYYAIEILLEIILRVASTPTAGLL